MALKANSKDKLRNEKDILEKISLYSKAQTFLPYLINKIFSFTNATKTSIVRSHYQSDFFEIIEPKTP